MWRDVFAPYGARLASTGGSTCETDTSPSWRATWRRTLEALSIPSCNAAAALPLLVFVQPSSERTLDPVRRDNSFSEKQECQLARLLVGA
jgi:hypothetical protein